MTTRLRCAACAGSGTQQRKDKPLHATPCLCMFCYALPSCLGSDTCIRECLCIVSLQVCCMRACLLQHADCSAHCRCGITSCGGACSRCWGTWTTSARCSSTASTPGLCPPQTTRPSGSGTGRAAPASACSQARRHPTSRSPVPQLPQGSFVQRQMVLGDFVREHRSAAGVPVPGFKHRVFQNN